MPEGTTLRGLQGPSQWSWSPSLQGYFGAGWAVNQKNEVKRVTKRVNKLSHISIVLGMKLAKFTKFKTKFSK